VTSTRIVQTQKEAIGVYVRLVLRGTAPHVKISMSVLRIPFFVMKTLTAQTPMDLTLVLAERDSLAMGPPVQMSMSV